MSILSATYFHDEQAAYDFVESRTRFYCLKKISASALTEQKLLSRHMIVVLAKP